MRFQSLSPLRLMPRWLAAMMLAAAMVLGPFSGSAQAVDTASSYVVDAKLQPDGRLDVKATVTLDGGPATLEQHFLTRRPAGPDTEYVYEITGLKASAAGKDLGAQVRTDGDAQVISVDTAKASGKPIVLSYSVKGAVAADEVTTGREATNTFSWHFLQGLNVGVTEVSGKLATAAQLSWIDCKSGSPRTPGACTMWQAGTHDSPLPVFSDGPRGRGEVLQLTFAMPATHVAANATVDHLWSLDRAFTVSWPTVGAALGTLALGALALWLLHRRRGRDALAESHPTMVAEFAPVAEGQSEFRLVEPVRPGQIGTVADEHVDPVDVTGTLLDLAVRGHLRIEQLPAQGHEPMDWSFTRLEGGEGELHEYERILLDAVAPASGEPTTVSHIAEAIGPVIGEVQDALYDDVVAQGWFDRRPDAARGNYQLIGWIAVMAALVVTGLLVAFTTFGLLGLALVVLALALVFIGQEMPRRSARGAELLAGLHAFASLLQHHRTDQMPPGRELQEISEVLPYAVVLGGRERWIDAMVAADDDEDADPTDLAWYHAPEDWHLHELPASLDAFIAAVQGRLFSR